MDNLKNTPDIMVGGAEVFRVTIESKKTTITPEMLQAGVRALAGYGGLGWEDEERRVAKIYLVMERARKRAKPITVPAVSMVWE